MMNALSKLLALSSEEKVARGVEHTPREIAQQPETWQQTFRQMRKVSDEVIEFVQSAGINPRSDRQGTIFLVGAGSSDYVGRSLVPLLSRRWHCDAIAVPSTDLLMDFDDLVARKRPQLWVSISRSGASPEGVAVLERALEQCPESKHVIISCDKDGRMLRETAGNPRVLGICLDGAVNDRGLAMTSSFSNMAIAGQSISYVANLDEYEEILSEIVSAGTDLLENATDCIAHLASQSVRNVCCVATGALRSAAAEAALKILELTAGKTQSSSESVLGFRHGPMAALGKESLFVCFLSKDEHKRKYDVDLLNEISAKQLALASVVVASTSGRPLHSFADRTFSPVRDYAIPDFCRTPLDAIFGQLLGLFLSLHWGLKPDAPSPNGAINRIVQNVCIHEEGVVES